MTQWGPIGREVYERTYSRRLEGGGREVWEQTVDRVVNGNMNLAPPETWLPGEHGLLRDMMLNFKIMPGGRHLWVSGVPDKQYVFNCHRAGWGRGMVEHFAFMFDALMCGGGVGSDYTDTPGDVPSEVQLGWGGPRSYIVTDSREGWVQALCMLLVKHFKPLAEPYLAFDLSRVRPAGERLKRFGGTAGGPEPLKRMLTDVNELLNRRAGRQLKPLDLMEIDHVIASCVVAGNVRRSARMSILHWTHPDIYHFIHCKVGDGNHWSTNISVGVDDNYWLALARQHPRALKVHDAVTSCIAKNGEPGLYNLSLARAGESRDVAATNPCGEIALEEWEPCNLGHLNLAALRDAEWPLAAMLMARFLVRATMSPDVHPFQRDVLEHNRRIGVGVYGVHEWMLNEGAKYSDVLHCDETSGRLGRRLSELHHDVREAADYAADELRVNRPIKYTTVAPTGTISLLSGHTAGAHPVAAKRFIRRVRYADTDPALEAFPPSMVEPDKYSANTAVVSMVCEDPLVAAHGDDVEDSHDLTIDEQLAVQEMLQRCWADNAVSYTVALPERATRADVGRAMRYWGPKLKGMTMFPQLTREQQPIERISQGEYDKLSAIMRAEVAQAEVECVNGACPVK